MQRSLDSQSSLFLGITPAPARDYLQRLFRAALGKYDRIVVPCAGRFSAPLMALSAGFKPQQIEASDISIFSDIIGTLASGKDPRELEVRVLIESIPELQTIVDEASDPIEYAAGVMLAMKIATTKPKNVYVAMIADDLQRGWRRHLEALKVGLSELTTRLVGIRYASEDLFTVVERDGVDPRAILYVDPPGFSRGYTKQFDAGDIVSRKPREFEEFSPKGGVAKLMDSGRSSSALVLILRATEDIGEDKSLAVWAMPAGKNTKYLLANRPDEARLLSGGVMVSIKPKPFPDPCLPVWGAAGDTLRADSKIVLGKTKREIGLYYRDLFAHTLGDTDTEVFFLMWVDGKVFGTIGLHLYNATHGMAYDSETDDRIFAWESFGFSARNARYPRHLNRLLMMCVTCEEFLRVLKRTTRFPLGDPVGIRTACITKGHESKGNRGILKLLERTPRPDGRFHLVYASEWRAGGFEDQMKAWVAKYGDQKTR